MENSENWAQAEEPEVEAGKDAFAEAQKAEVLRQQITTFAAGAVKYGVDRDWVNGQLNMLGAEQVTGQAEYKINIPVTGLYGTTVTAGSQAEARNKFSEIVAQHAAAGLIRTINHCGEGIYDVDFPASQAAFFSGPQDFVATEDAPTLDLAGLRAGIRQMIMRAIAEHGWGYGHAQHQIQAMGLEKLPTRTRKTIEVPVAGVAQVDVAGFEGDDDESWLRSATHIATGAQRLIVKPQEIGVPFLPRPDGDDVGMTLVDDDDEPAY